MTTVALLEKAYGSFSMKRFEASISALCKDLKVRISVRSALHRDWIHVDVDGEDEIVALSLLDKEIGLAPTSAGKVSKFSVLRGRVFESSRASTELCVDVGVFEPEKRVAVVPLWRLQSQLSDGKKTPLGNPVGLFCLYDFAPLHVKIVDELNDEKDFWEAELSEVQLSTFSDWIRSNLDRLIVLGASRKEVEEAVERARHFRDVVRIETLGPFEHALLCKLGTDAVGLVPRLGPYLAASNLAPFSPERIKQFVGGPGRT